MDPFDALVLIAELSLGIAGFSGVVVALGSLPGSWPRVDRLRLAALLTTSLGAMFIALFSLLLVMLDIDVGVVWRISSLVLALLLTVVMIAIVPGAWSITRETAGLTSPYAIGVFIPTVVLVIATALAGLANAAGMFGADAFGVYFGGLVVLLLISGIQFVRLFFVAR